LHEKQSMFQCFTVASDIKPPLKCNLQVKWFQAVWCSKGVQTVCESAAM